MSKILSREEMIKNCWMTLLQSYPIDLTQEQEFAVLREFYDAALIVGERCFEDNRLVEYAKVALAGILSRGMLVYDDVVSEAFDVAYKMLAAENAKRDRK